MYVYEPLLVGVKRRVVIIVVVKPRGGTIKRDSDIQTVEVILTEFVYSWLVLRSGSHFVLYGIKSLDRNVRFVGVGSDVKMVS